MRRATDSDPQLGLHAVPELTRRNDAEIFDPAKSEHFLVPRDEVIRTRRNSEAQNFDIVLVRYRELKSFCWALEQVFRKHIDSSVNSCFRDAEFQTEYFAKLAQHRLRCHQIMGRQNQPKNIGT